MLTISGGASWKLSATSEVISGTWSLRNCIITLITDHIVQLGPVLQDPGATGGEDDGADAGDTKVD